MNIYDADFSIDLDQLNDTCFSLNIECNNLLDIKEAIEKTADFDENTWSGKDADDFSDKLKKHANGHVLETINLMDETQNALSDMFSMAYDCKKECMELANTLGAYRLYHPRDGESHGVLRANYEKIADIKRQCEYICDGSTCIREEMIKCNNHLSKLQVISIDNSTYMQEITYGCDDLDMFSDFGRKIQKYGQMVKELDDTMALRFSELLGEDELSIESVDTNGTSIDGNSKYIDSIAKLQDQDKTINKQTIMIDGIVYKDGDTTIINGKKVTIDLSAVSNQSFEKLSPNAVEINDSNYKTLLNKEDQIKYQQRYINTREGVYGIEHPVIATIESIIEAPIAGLEGGIKTLATLVTGDEDYMKRSVADKQNALRDGVMSNILNDTGRNVYDIGTDAADMTVDATIGAVTGGGAILSGILMGGHRSIEATNESFERTDNAHQAALYGTISGVENAYFNTKGLNKYTKGIDGTKIERVLKFANIEGLENLAQSATEDLADLIINQEDSVIVSSYNNYTHSGMGKIEAVQNVAGDTIGQYARDYITGAEFGALFGGINEITNIKRVDSDTTGTVNKTGSEHQSTPSASKTSGSLEYQTSYGKSSGKLNWDTIVSKKGETRIEHINRHAVPNNRRETHGVFNGNPVDMVNGAWQQRGMVEPISDGMGGSIYNIPYKNAGYESGYVNTGAEMDYITIVVMDESNDLITAFPSFGDYSK